jgi:uncharacterized protein
MRKCPTCRNPVDWQNNPFRPFCSERCQLVDLGKWVEGEYRVPGEPIPPDTIPAPHTNEESDERD